MRTAADRLKFIKRQEPVLVEAPPVSDDWIHEIKYDGYRTKLVVEWAGGRAFAKMGHDWSKALLAVRRGARKNQGEITDPGRRDDCACLKTLRGEPKLGHASVQDLWEINNGGAV